MSKTNRSGRRLELDKGALVACRGIVKAMMTMRKNKAAEKHFIKQ